MCVCVCYEDTCLSLLALPAHRMRLALTGSDDEGVPDRAGTRQWQFACVYGGCGRAEHDGSFVWFAGRLHAGHARSGKKVGGCADGGFVSCLRFFSPFLEHCCFFACVSQASHPHAGTSARAALFNLLTSPTCELFVTKVHATLRRCSALQVVLQSVYVLFDVVRWTLRRSICPGWWLSLEG